MGITDLVGDIFGGQTSINGYEPNQQETDLKALQAGQLKNQNNLQNLLLPYQLKQMGLTGTFGADGSLSGVTEIAPTEEQQKTSLLNKSFLDLALSQVQGQASNLPQTQEIQKQLQNRELAALKGELPVNPALTRELGEQGDVLHESLRKQLGTGYETSDPGIRALATFNQRKNETLDAARRNDLTLTEQLGQARAASNFNAASGGFTSADLAEKLRGSKLGELAGISGAFNSGINNLNPFLSNSLQDRYGRTGFNLQSDMFNTKTNQTTFENQMQRNNDTNNQAMKSISSIFSMGG